MRSGSRNLAATRSILGRTINLSGDLYTIIGVMPATFRFPVTDPQIGIWTTLAVDDDPNDPHPCDHQPRLAFSGRDRKAKTRRHRGAGQPGPQHHRQQPGETISRYQLAARCGPRVGELSSLIGDTRTALLIVLGAVALVLLIACGNIANLLLARMRERQREIAMRSALGAGRARIVRQLLVESLALSAAGGVAGCGLAYLCTPAILSLIGDSIPRAANAGVDLRVLGFAMAVAFAAGIIFGIVPALTASRTDLVSNLKEGSRTEMSGRDWLRSSLIVGQVALGLVLTAGAGLLMTSFLHLRNPMWASILITC